MSENEFIGDDEAMAIYICTIALKKLEGTPAVERVLRYLASRQLEKLYEARATISELIKQVQELEKKAQNMGAT